MIKVEIKDAQVKNRSGISKTTGKPYSINSQQAYLHTGKPYPEEFTITLEDGHPPYAAGVYTADLESMLYVDRRYGEIKLGRLKLVPVAARTAA